MKSGDFYCHCRCQLVKYAARYRSSLAQADILDSAVQPVDRDQFQQIQPIAVIAGRGPNQVDIYSPALGERVGKKIPPKSANRACHPAVPEGAKKQHKIRLASKMTLRRGLSRAIPRPDRVCCTYPQNLWITLFMNLVHRPQSRASTGMQGLFKKYRKKNVCIKIK
ncbi:TPA: hypothetical protein ACSP84_002886 [Aeromonas veronii]|uniref:Uncharacterized protein n=1 Tax=Aeromonas veronii AMC34 TaxID=1073383 RepID=K1IM84_AERVE|nr:hypothetical protein [Aeromonas veronii]EKB19266.1 hypothetical protein HMPREF1168_03040 [Aeromonas veronii AMC34]MCF5765203.1 hypothetical protein [Aeromonas veronii]